MSDRQANILELLDTSGARLHALLSRLTLDGHATGDLMQELFIRLSNSSGFDRAENQFAYAYKVATNLAFDWRKKHKIKHQPLEEAYLSPDSEPSVLERMIRTEELNQILDATSQLSELARNVVVMRHIEQMPYEEIAGHLKRSPHYLRSVDAKAMARLQSLLVKQKQKKVWTRAKLPELLLHTLANML